MMPVIRSRVVGPTFDCHRMVAHRLVCNGSDEGREASSKDTVLVAIADGLWWWWRGSFGACIPQYGVRAQNRRLGNHEDPPALGAAQGPPGQMDGRHQGGATPQAREVEPLHSPSTQWASLTAKSQNPGVDRGPRRGQTCQNSGTPPVPRHGSTGSVRKGVVAREANVRQSKRPAAIATAGLAWRVLSLLYLHLIRHRRRRGSRMH